jgi:hypothetical protein
MLEAMKHSDRSLAECAYCPRAPNPQPRPLKPIALIRTLSAGARPPAISFPD